MHSTTPPFTSLSRQAARRVLAVFLIIGALSASLLSLAWHLANQGLQREQVELNTTMIQTRLGSRHAEWQRSAEALATQITFNHMLESSDEARWDKLRAYLNALGEGLQFDTVAVIDNSGRIVFRQGEEADEMDFLVATDQPEWHFSERQRHAHRILRAPIWLGLQGKQGMLYLLKAIDNRFLIDLASPGTKLALTYHDEVIASSRGNSEIGQRRGQHEGAGDPAWRDLPLSPPGLRLSIRQTLPQAISPMQFAVAGIGLATLLAFALTAVFGLWLRRTVARVQALSRAADGFGKQHRLDGKADAALAQAAGPQDELNILRQRLRELMQSSQERDEESRAYLQTLELLEEAVVELDANGILLRASPAWATLIGLDNEANTLGDYFDPEERAHLRQQLALLFSGDKAQLTLRLRAVTPQRGGTWLECRFVPALDNEGGGPITRVRGVLRDITQTYMQEKHITQMALHDALTSLPNRILLEDRIKIAMRMATRDHSRVGIGFIDLDHFKNINDALGHKAGDQVLVAFSSALRERLRTGDTLARWGGDEFVVLLPDMPDLDSIRHVADKLATTSREPVRIEGNSLPVTFSMGFTVYPDDGEDVDVLLSQADRAMFYAKSQGRNMVQFYVDMAKKGLGKKDLYIQSRLAAAINNGAIQAWFQPLVDARSRRPIGLEALARWRDPELGWIPPSTFIPMAENLGLIAELGELVMTRTLTMGRHLQDAGHDLLLAINISKRQLFLGNCIEHLLRDATTAGVDPGRIMLEITESVAMSEVDHSESRLRALHEAGFMLAVDDFGVGYSSLSQLHEMPMDELKIDISFTRRVHDPQGARLIQAIVGMAQALHLRIVAEGVEDAATADALERMGVHSFQGYHFGKPMPAAEFEDWLNAQGGSSDPAGHLAQPASP